MKVKCVQQKLHISLGNIEILYYSLDKSLLIEFVVLSITTTTTTSQVKDTPFAGTTKLDLSPLIELSCFIYCYNYIPSE